MAQQIFGAGNTQALQVGLGAQAGSPFEAPVQGASAETHLAGQLRHADTTLQVIL